jgi:hypothetical protein
MSEKGGAAAAVTALTAKAKLAGMWREKVDQSVKDAIEQVAERIGGVDRMVEWVQEDPENERVFWVSIYPKLLPVQLAGDKHNPIRGDVTFTWMPPAD